MKKIDFEKKEEELARVIRAPNRWTPAKDAEGNPVKSQYNIPLPVTVQK